ncbi:MAG TPA: alpha/beta hydrolase [Acidimicrobiia bacterium]
MEESTLVLADGRVVGFATYGPNLGVPVVWCHGGPGSRLEPAGFEPFLERLGLRVIGIDRPGYGRSSLQPGRSIADWVPDCISVADALDVERFLAVGVSTGGAYALAVAATAPERVRAVVPCCAMTDMRHRPSRETMSKVHCHDLWNAPDRAAAIEVARAAFGDDGSRYMSAADTELCAADMAFLERAATDPAQEVSMRAQFANGVQGYVDDRLADGPGWVSFDVAAVDCPVAVVHGSDDRIVDPVNARHTTSLIPQATLRIEDGHGHLSVIASIVGPFTELATGTH